MLFREQELTRYMADVSTEIRQLISSSKLRAAIDLLSQQIAHKDKDLELQLSVLTSRLERLNRESRMGLLSRTDENSERTRITFGLLGLVSDSQDYLVTKSKSPEEPQVDLDEIRQRISQKEAEIALKKLDVLLEKLDYLKEQEVMEPNAVAKFQLKKQISEIEEEIDKIKEVYIPTSDPQKDLKDKLDLLRQVYAIESNPKRKIDLQQQIQDIEEELDM